MAKQTKKGQTVKEKEPDCINFRAFCSPQTHWFIRLSAILLIIIFLVLGVFYIVPSILPEKRLSNAEIGGVIMQNQQWSGTIKVVGDLFVVPGAKITLLPGTRVLVAIKGDRFNFDFVPWHYKHGVNTGPEEKGIKTGEPFWDEGQKILLHFSRVLAQGTKENPVVIVSDSVSGSPYDINLISISEGNLDYVNFSHYRRLEIGPGVAISNSSFMDTGECAVCVGYGEPKILGNVFKESRRRYLEVGLGSPEIRGNKFLESQGEGIIFHGDKYSNLRVFGNFFQMPGRKAVKVVPVDEGGEMVGNIFTEGTVELPCNSKIRLEQNWIKGQVIFDNPSSCRGKYILGSNYWEIKEPENVLKSRIVGVTESFQVQIPSVLLDPPMNFEK